MPYPVGYVLTGKGWRALFQPQLDELAASIRDQLYEQRRRDEVRRAVRPAEAS